MAVDVVKLNHLLVIARTGSFSRAADELGITQPALSRSVASLELRYGFRIFDRGPGGVSPTAVGAMVLADAQALIRDSSILEHNLRLYGRGEAGKVSFGMGPLIGSLLLPGLSVHLLGQRPQLQLRCAIKTVEALLRDLLSDAVEVVFCAGRLTPAPEIIIERLGVVRLGIIARAGHPLASKPSPRIADLAAYPFASAVELGSQELPGRGGALICDNYELLRMVTLRGDAVWFSSPQVVVEDLAEGRLIEIPVVDMPFQQTEVSMVRLKGRTSSPAAKSLMAYVAERLANDATVPKRRTRAARP
ncbi:MAG: LysR family transcriptional regulator [Rhodospirillaceae bacterium]|nr:MAG: LysR family transcriptional regulator [Rhodospirillaceae bacterium]